MKRNLRYYCLALPLAVALCVLNLSAATLTIPVDTEISGSGGVLSGSGEIIATFDDGDGTGSVDLTLDLSGLTDPQDFLTAFYFNFTGSDFTGFDITSSDPTFDGFVTGFDSFQADGDGQFDVRIDFSTSNAPSSDRLVGGETATLVITYDGLTVDFFDAASAPGGGNGTWTAIARVQGLGAGDDSEGSGWFAGNPDGGGGEQPVIPEPSTLLLIGGALLGLAFYRTRSADRN